MKPLAIPIKVLGIILILYSFIYGEQKITSSIVTKDMYQTTDTASSKIPLKKGEYALASIFNKDEMAWAKKFDMAELGGVDDPHKTFDIMKKAGAFVIKKDIGYDWMPAFYYYTSGENRKFVRWLYKHKDSMLLNPNGPYLHCQKEGYNWCKDYYYDYGNDTLLKARVDDLIANISSKGFKGVFFDWASGGFILSSEYKQMKELFQKRHPRKNYFKSIAKFYKALKDRDIFVITNQAFRKEKYGLLKYIDYDMTESYITTDIEKKVHLQLLGKGWVDNIKVTNYYPIYDNSNSLKDSLYFIDLLTSYKKKYKKYGFKNFIYLNYIAPDYEKVYASASLYRKKKPKNAIYFSYAMGKLTNNIVYAELSDDRKLERDKVYFYDLGEALGKSYIKLQKPKDSYVRFYEKGFVLVSDAKQKEIYLKISSNFIPKNRKIYDAYNDIWLQSKKNSLILKLKYQKGTFSDLFLPLGRVFLYNQK